MKTSSSEASPSGDPPLLFPSGRVSATSQALAVLNEADIIDALGRHFRGDWGDIDAEDKAANDAALIYGHRLLSAYGSRGGARFWIITEWDRSATTVLLPAEY